MFPSLEQKLARFEELERLLQAPDIAADIDRMIELQREHGGLTRVATQVRAFYELEENLAAAREMADEETDADARAYAESEVADLETQRETAAADLEELAAAGDAATRGSLIMEVRSGAGGDEAALFARDLFEMYRSYCERSGWKLEVIDSSATDLGGFREITFSVSGEGAFLNLQFESGGHRVQRVPETETQGRVHTSAATVAVLPEANEVEVELDPQDLQIDTMRAGGPGGQKVNKTESAVRITHVPSGIVVKIQDEKSQHKNRAKAMRVLRSRLLEKRESEANAARADARRTLIGSGDRSERVRTYNFPQNRVTDHRIGLSVHKLDQVMQGDLEELIGGLLEFDRQERLNAAE